jgi:hypothetical protein
MYKYFDGGNDKLEIIRHGLAVTFRIMCLSETQHQKITPVLVRRFNYRNVKFGINILEHCNKKNSSVSKSDRPMVRCVMKQIMHTL